MKAGNDIQALRRDLRDFIRLIFAFFLGLILISLYQNIRLFSAGVLDRVLNKSLLLLIVHHIGFTAISAMILVFPFKFLERLRPNFGFNAVTVMLVLMFSAEGLLTKYYLDHYEILGAGFAGHIRNAGGLSFLYYTPVFLFSGIISMFFFYRITSRVYSLVSRMYPFTLILFSLFFATLITRKNPVNENKTEHLVYHQLKESFDFNKYEGAKEYPLLKSFVPASDLSDYFDLKQEPPNLVFIIMDGVGSDFLGEKAPFKAFMPNLNSLQQASLYWPHTLSNTGETAASIPAIFGSLPFGDKGFTQLESLPRSYTLFDLLRETGYQTAFYFGGNISLNNLGKFLDREELGQISDRKAFSTRYKPQEEDAAGISLGYPDGELFRKWVDDYASVDRPRLDVFLTQSTKAPFLIPSRDHFEKEVETIAAQEDLSRRNKRLIRKNKEVFASLLYADKALSEFIENYRRKAEYYNTIFIITGSHNMNDLPQQDYLARYKVPLMMFSPMLKSPARISSLVAHTDVLPELAGLLGSQYKARVPERVSWLGDGLFHERLFKKDKIIPLFRHKDNLQEYIKGNFCISGSDVYEIGADLTLFEPKEITGEEEIKSAFRQFRAINRYVTSNNKLYPEKQIAQDSTSIEKGKTEMVWINSVFNSDDYDNAYRTARDLAISGERDRALLLCDHILEQVPGHADTEILKGRIFAWDRQYEKAAGILEKTIRKYPVYADAYSALLDVYFWSDSNEKVADIKVLIRKHGIQNDELRAKIKRAENKLKSAQTLSGSGNLGYLKFEEGGNE